MTDERATLYILLVLSSTIYTKLDELTLRLQDPVRLNNYSEPEPDIAVVIPDPLYYEDHHPTPSEVYLIIEVADTSSRYYDENRFGD